ncbi:hypothetical protein [Arthrobacter sp. 35W]|uniref:hypothetical protein n=1 Tax=Arthrobacter sp. 35W TaxID=1132441 RepID=UPI0004132729
MAGERHLLAAGQVIIADKGFADRDFEAFATGGPGAHQLRPDHKECGLSVVRAEIWFRVLEQRWLVALL